MDTSFFLLAEEETGTCWQWEFVFSPVGKSHCLNGRGGKYSTKNINREALLLVRVCSKLLHNTLFPRLVNKFAVASWRFIAQWLYPRANELVRLFPGTTSSSRRSLEKRNSRGSWAALHHQSSTTNLTPGAPPAWWKELNEDLEERTGRGDLGTGGGQRVTGSGLQAGFIPCPASWHPQCKPLALPWVPLLQS